MCLFLKRKREKNRIQGKQDGRGESGRLDDRHLHSSLTSRLHAELQREKARVFYPGSPRCSNHSSQTEMKKNALQTMICII